MESNSEWRFQVEGTSDERIITSTKQSELREHDNKFCEDTKEFNHAVNGSYHGLAADSLVMI